MRSGDITGQAAIRDSAARLFAERGADAVTVRQIAADAGVSAALVLHHYGSKAGLEAAVDAWVADQLDALMDQGEELGETLAGGEAVSVAELFAGVFAQGSPLPAYLRRKLISGDPAFLAIFRRWFQVSDAFVREMTDAGLARPSADPAARAAFFLAADVALLLLQEPLADVLGVDPLSPQGLARWAAEVSAIYREGAFIPPSSESDER